MFIVFVTFIFYDIKYTVKNVLEIDDHGLVFQSCCKKLFDEIPEISFIHDLLIACRDSFVELKYFKLRKKQDLIQKLINEEDSNSVQEIKNKDIFSMFFESFRTFEKFVRVGFRFRIFNYVFSDRCWTQNLCQNGSEGMDLWEFHKNRIT